ncbi:ParA-like protein [Candidatus Micrarchaeum sp.]|uniref:MinD/ParA family ATP-binding protein n=1 Tax=Candidatus Micrarchaeum sp. TaxID=2282148 RepID=UPI0019347EB0|nr:MinD/ParA family protein [Candidatus Micrarchaeum sp.]QRF74382.1 ParA-like protein [Candidatus Micrarchaeum sp.]
MKKNIITRNSISQRTNPYIVRISAQKGGVGKTTVAVNLAIAMKMRGYLTLLVDADTSNPAIGIHLGLDYVNAGFIDHVRGRASTESVVVTHAPSGLAVICGSITNAAFMLTYKEAKTSYDELKKSRYDLIVIDTEPGYVHDVVTEGINETIIVSNPDMPSYISALRISEYFSSKGILNSMVVNRVAGKRHEISSREIIENFNGKVGFLPEDDIVPISIAAKTPAVMLNPKSKFSKAIDEIADDLSSRIGMPLDNDVVYGYKAGKKRIFGSKR